MWNQLIDNGSSEYYSFYSSPSFMLFQRKKGKKSKIFCTLFAKSK